MTANNEKFYLHYSNKLVDEWNNTYYHSIDKKPINADCSALTKEIEKNPKSSKFKFGDESILQSIKAFLVRATTKIGWKKYLWCFLCRKLILGGIKFKI